MQDAWYGTDGWHLQQLTTAPGVIASEWVIPTPGPLAAGDVFVSVYNGQQHFAGQVTIPAKLRGELGLAEGDYVDISREGSRIVLTPKEAVDRHPVIDAALA